MLERKITSWTLCVETLLSFQKVVVEDIHDDSLLRSPYDANALLGAKVEHDALDEMLAKTGILPDVMVIAAANVGAQLVAERHGIRSVLMAPDNMLSVVAEKTFPSTGPIDLFKRRKDSFFLAHRFMQMNKLRQKFKLPLLRNPADYFEKATFVIIDDLPFPVMLPSNTYFGGPLLPPCIPCRQEEDEDDSTTILVTTPGLDAADTRVLIKATAMARAEFESFVRDTCHPDTVESKVKPQLCAFGKTMANFKVVWQTDNDTILPELLPAFLKEDSSSALEILSTHSHKVEAIISHCDSETYRLVALIGQRLDRVLCIPTSNGKSESTRRLIQEIQDGSDVPFQSSAIASSLVNILINIHDDSVSCDSDSDSQNRRRILEINGGNSTLEIIDIIATAPRNETVESLRERVNERVNRTSKTKTDIVLLLVASSAWNVLFIISLGYCLRLIYVTSDPGMTSQTRRFLRSPSIQAAFEYLEELDWALLFAEKFWWYDESMIHNRIDRFLRRYEPEEEVVEATPPAQLEPKREAPGNNTRRKRHAKKR
jgi:hypothetical protein